MQLSSAGREDSHEESHLIAQYLTLKCQLAMLLAMTVLLVGCSTMPSVEAQQSALSAQSFNADYRLAVTSWMTDPTFEVIRDNESVNVVWDDHVENLVSLQKAANSAWYVTDSKLIPFTNVAREGHYNQRDRGSTLEQALASQLSDSLDVSVERFSRILLTDPKSQFESPMHQAKAKVAELGYDALAMFYFEPRVRVTVGDVMPLDGERQFVSLEAGIAQSRSRSTAKAPYAMAYNTHIAIRALEPDVLLYSHIETYTCNEGDEEYSLPSGIVVTRQQQKSFSQCEHEIVKKAIAKLELAIRSRR